MIGLEIFFGALVGFALGLTGGGGSLFAVPLLVYGLSVSAHEAVGVSLASVGATALYGALQRWRSGQIEARTGLLFAAAGMAGAPAGSWINARTPEPVLLLGFSALMLFISVRMWRTARAHPAEARVVRAIPSAAAAASGPACHRDPEGRLKLTSRCAWAMIAVGLATGCLSGLFGVGGGFIIVPALVFFTSMDMHRAVGTSLLVIALVSTSGVVSYLAADRPLDLTVTLLFLAGGIVGLTIGSGVGRRISGPRLQSVFSVFILLVAIFVIVKTLSTPAR